MKKITLILVSLLSLTISNCAGKKPAMYIMPFINTPDHSSGVINWVSRNDIQGVEVNLRKENSTAVKTIHPTKTQLNKSSKWIYSVPLTGLTEGERYTYSFNFDEVLYHGTFTTGTKNDSALKFVVYGDTRSRPNLHQDVSRAIAADSPQFVICVGDLTSHGNKLKNWRKEFFTPAEAYLANSVLWPVRGNHEEDAVLYRELFNLPSNELYYSVNYGNIHFITLDSHGSKEERRNMLHWLKEDLETNRSQWTLVFYHVPTFNVGGHASKWGRKDVLPLLELHNVDIVLTGHSHLYERFLPIGPQGKKPIIHITTGGGGAIFSKSVPNPLLENGIGISKIHYCYFSIKDDKLTMEVKTPDGKVLDSLELIKKNGNYQPDIMDKSITTHKAIEILSSNKN